VTAALLACALVGAGCRGDTPPLGHVRGTVYRGGKPVKNLVVNFMPGDGGRPSIATTDADGNYLLHYDPEHDGASLGPHTVSVIFDRPPGGDAAGKGVSLKGDDRREVSQKYGSLEESPLKISVRKGWQVVNLHLD
jgi:hypothetical protein